MKLEKRFYREGTSSYVNEGNHIPKWFPDWENISKWYWDELSYYYYNMVDNEDFYLQYGKDDEGWSAARFLGSSIKILEESLNDDNSITCTVEVTSNFFVGKANNRQTNGYNCNYELRINDKVIHKFSGNSRDRFDYGKSDPITYTVTIPPEKENTQSTFFISFEYPDYPNLSSNVKVGIALYNPNPPLYIPMAIRKSGSWKDLNGNKGKIKRRISGSFVDKSEENYNTVKQIDKGKNRLRKSGNFRQLPAMKGGTPNG